MHGKKGRMREGKQGRRDGWEKKRTREKVWMGRRDGRREGWEMREDRDERREG